MKKQFYDPEKDFEKYRIVEREVGRLIFHEKSIPNINKNGPYDLKFNGVLYEIKSTPISSDSHCVEFTSDSQRLAPGGPFQTWAKIGPNAIYMFVEYVFINGEIYIEQCYLAPTGAVLERVKELVSQNRVVPKAIRNKRKGRWYTTGVLICRKEDFKDVFVTLPGPNEPMNLSDSEKNLLINEDDKKRAESSRNGKWNYNINEKKYLAELRAKSFNPEVANAFSFLKEKIIEEQLNEQKYVNNKRISKIS